MYVTNFDRKISNRKLLDPDTNVEDFFNKQKILSTDGQWRIHKIKPNLLYPMDVVLERKPSLASTKSGIQGNVP